MREFEMNKVFLGFSILAVSSLIGTPSFADSNSEIFAVSPTAVTHAEITDLCPANARCITGGVKVELSFMIPCAGLMGPISTKVILGEDGKQKLLVSAVAITTKASTVSRCFTQSFATEILSLSAVYLSNEDIIDLNSNK
jgi:hypothetical protein